jgi:4'-phosphopantetheinyl transferase
VRPDDVGAQSRSFLFAMLDATERERARRFVFDLDRDCYIFAHALLRLTLARYLDADPHTLRFIVGANGRPELAAFSGSIPPRFNLSHTRGLVACIVAATTECGVDVERVGRVSYRELMPVLFAASEAAELDRLPEEQRADRFLEIWTLKEAYLKARGLGLTVPLKDIAFTCFGPAPRCTFGPALGDDGCAWRFWSGRPTDVHRAAVAMRTGAGGSIFSIFELGSDLRSFRTKLVLRV